MRQLRRVGTAAWGLGAEDLDHPDHRAEQAQQRRGAGDGPQRGQEALQVMRDGAAGWGIFWRLAAYVAPPTITRL